MERATKRQQGFTLIELMITVAIIGILASTALTLFVGQQMRSKRTEAMTNVESLAKMAKGYFGESGFYPSVAGYWPAPIPDAKPLPWDNASSTAFSAIGFRAEGAVRYRYDLDGRTDCGCPDCFTVAAFGDLDGDTNPAVVGYFHPPSAGPVCATNIGAYGPDPRGGGLVLDETHALVQNPLLDDY